jgi:hypothetical protein
MLIIFSWIIGIRCEWLPLKTWVWISGHFSWRYHLKNIRVVGRYDLSNKVNRGQSRFNSYLSLFKILKKERNKIKPSDEP